MLSFFAPCPRGLEALLSAELASLGALEARVVPGGVLFGGGWGACYRANLWSRLASRILWKLEEFDYKSEQDIYDAAHRIDWPRLFDVRCTLKVAVVGQKSPLKSLGFITLKIKDAICDRFREASGLRPNVERAEPDVRVHAFLGATRAMLYLDTSGEPLFKRGWRVEELAAPLRENLAAGILILAGWTAEQPLLDPMCGGGTFLVEAAAMARKRAPGLKRLFGFEKLRDYDKTLWSRLLKEAAQPLAASAPLEIFGSDADARALSATRRNLAAAGVERWVKLERIDVLERQAPAASGVLIANPPYGERMGSEEELAKMYPLLGDTLKKNFSGWNCFLFTGDLRLPKLIRLEPSRRIPLFNGAIECRLYQFEIVAGSHRRARGGRGEETLSTK